MEAAAEVGEGVQLAVVAVEEDAQVEWEEAAAVAVAGLRCREEVIAVARVIAAGEDVPGEAIAAAGATGPPRGPVGWLRIGTRPEETLTGLRSRRRFNLVRKVPGQRFPRLLKEEGVGPARLATKGFPMWVEEGVPVNSREEVKVVPVAGSKAPRAVRSPIECRAVNSREEVKVPPVAGSKVPRAVRFPTECRAVNWARWQGGRWRGARSPVVSGIWAAAI